MTRPALVTAALLLAVPMTAAGEPVEGRDSVVRSVMLMRHGVRAPLSDPPLPAGKTAAAWPRWPVGRAELTPHGYAGVRLVGRFDRAVMRNVSNSACPDPASVVVETDNDQRTMETGRAWIEGFAPGCGLVPTHLSDGIADPVFAPIEAKADSVDASALKAAVEGRLALGGLTANDAAAWSLLQRLDAVLCGRLPRADCGVSRTPTTFRPSRRGREPALRGALADGATAVQTLTLAYAEGMQGVGWGRLRAGDLARLGALRARGYAIVFRTPEVARAFGGPTLRRMSQALQPTSTATTTVLVGHDSNVAAVAGLLDLHWRAAGFATDDPSPSGALELQVLRDKAGNRFVQAFFRSPSLEQIRSLRPVRGRQVRRALPITACAPTPLRCPEDRFAKIVVGVLG